MKVIVISGARSGVGKTTLAQNIAKTLGEGNCEIIKIGSSVCDSAKQTRFFSSCSEGLSYIQNPDTAISYLLIESNSILQLVTPDLVIYLAADYAKTSAELAKAKADIIIEEKFCPSTAAKICQSKLGNDLIIEPLLCQFCWSYCAAIILAGGNSSRMGVDKALLPNGDKTMLTSLIAKLKTQFAKVYVSTKAEIEYELEVPVIVDQKTDCGPLMGIYSSLQRSNYERNFILPTDLPVINLADIMRLLYYTGDHDIVVPSHDGRVEPLYGFYAKQTAAKIATLLAREEKKVIALLGECNTKILPMEMSWHKNLNTREDYEHYFAVTG